MELQITAFPDVLESNSIVSLTPRITTANSILQLCPSQPNPLAVAAFRHLSPTASSLRTQRPAASADKASMLRRCCPLRLPLFLGFLIPALCIAAAFFAVTWATFDHAATQSIETISTRLFEVCILHVQDSLDSFLQSLPTIVHMLKAYMDSTGADKDRLLDFMTRYLATFDAASSPLVIAVSYNDGSVYGAHQSAASGLHVIQRHLFPTHSSSLYASIAVFRCDIFTASSLLFIFSASPF